MSATWTKSIITDRSVQVAMKNLALPGRIVRSMCLEPTGLTVTKAARHLKVSRQALNNLVNEKAAMCPDIAIRLEMAFGLTAEMWLSMQLAYDLARAYESADTIHVEAFAAVA